VFTTDSTHALPIYPNLARRFKLTGLNQLWVADITFIRLGTEFVYLAVVLDAYSRRVIGWELSRTLEAGLAIRALQMALRERDWNPEELVHHSDRGVQYASGEYTALLEQGEIQISMSRRGNPYDNARAERFMRTLKQEEVYGTEYLDLEDARSRIGEFLEQVYNRQRLHSALRYLTPEEFEQACAARGSDGADGSGGKPKNGLPPLPQALEIPPGLPHSRGSTAAQI
jgi:transposase InsO family protein